MDQAYQLVCNIENYIPVGNRIDFFGVPRGGRMLVDMMLHMYDLPNIRQLTKERDRPTAPSRSLDRTEVAGRLALLSATHQEGPCAETIVIVDDILDRGRSMTCWLEAFLTTFSQAQLTIMVATLVRRMSPQALEGRLKNHATLGSFKVISTPITIHEEHWVVFPYETVLPDDTVLWKPKNQR